MRCNGIDNYAPLVVAPAHIGHECGSAQIKTVGEGKADQQHAYQYPPDQLQCFVIKHAYFLKRGPAVGSASVQSGSAPCANYLGQAGQT